MRLREKRDKYRERILRTHLRIEDAKGTALYSRYNDSKRRIHSLTNLLRKKREDEIILDFHDTIDDHDIDRQFGDAKEQFHGRSVVKYEFRERATITRLLNEPLHGLDEIPAIKLRIQFIDNLTSYCGCVESRQDDTNIPEELDSKPSLGPYRYCQRSRCLLMVLFV